MPHRPIYTIADVHAGNHAQFGGPLTSSINARCRMILDVCEATVEHVLTDNGILVVAGDLIDVVRPVAPLLAELQRIFSRVETIMIKGNHDSNSDQPGDHALAPLSMIATVIETPQIVELDGVNLWCVPARPDKVSDWMPATLKALSATGSTTPAAANVLVLHAGISDPKTAKFLAHVNDQISAVELAGMCAPYDILQVFAGNWHDRREWEHFGVHIQQVGALVPTGWDNPGLSGYGGVARYQDGEVTMNEMPGPRFVKLNGDAEAAVNLVQSAPNPELLFLQVITAPERMADVSAALEPLRDAGQLAAYKVMADKVYREAAAATAANSARSAEGFEAALTVYSARMPLASDCIAWLVEQKASEPDFRDEVAQGIRDTLVKAMTNV